MLALMAHEPSRHEREQATRRQALEDLDRLRHEGGSFLGSALAAAGRRAADHFAARDADDPVERWGRRIGRALSLAAFLALCVYLYLTYLR
jgi:cytochrome c-type biogenesis protein CcmH/NrfG